MNDFTARGIGYNIYNINNIYNTNNETNKDNTLGNGESPLVASTSRPSGHSLSPTATVPQCVLKQPTPQYSDRIKSCIVQLFYNDNSVQKYKLKIRFNFINNQNPEFIASLTQDRRNFVKHIPLDCKEEVVDWIDSLRAAVKHTYEINKPYIGKLHYYNGNRLERHEIEPNTAVGVWQIDDLWACMIKFNDWEMHLDLFSEYLTAKQKQSGVIAQTTWENPKHAKPRAKTWREIEMGL